MKAQVKKWRNSLVLTIPKSLAIAADLEAGTAVEVSLVHGAIVVTPLSRPTPTLEQLLARITDANLHHEVITGAAVGKEVW